MPVVLLCFRSDLLVVPDFPAGRRDMDGLGGGHDFSVCSERDHEELVVSAFFELRASDLFDSRLCAVI